MNHKDNGKIKIALIDDDPGICDVVKDVLLGSAMQCALYYKSTIPEFKLLVESVKPDVTLIDVFLPHEDQGFEVLEWVRGRCSTSKNIILTGQSKDVLEAILKQADGFLSKSEIGLLPLAVKEIINQGSYVSPKNCKLMVNQIKEYENKFRELIKRGITATDMENLSALSREKSNTKAAQKLNKNLFTFKSQNTRILKKFKRRRMRDVLKEFKRLF